MAAYAGLPMGRRTMAGAAAVVIGLALLVALAFMVFGGGEAVTDDDPVPLAPPASTEPGPLTPDTPQTEPTP